MPDGLYCPYCHRYAGEIKRNGDFWCPRCGRRAEIDYDAVVQDYGTDKAKQRWRERQTREPEQLSLRLTPAGRGV